MIFSNTYREQNSEMPALRPLNMFSSHRPEIFEANRRILIERILFWCCCSLSYAYDEVHKYHGHQDVFAAKQNKKWFKFKISEHVKLKATN